LSEAHHDQKPSRHFHHRIILAAIVFAGRVMRKDESYLHAKHVSELHEFQPIGA
jgi:hypothetical protein